MDGVDYWDAILSGNLDKLAYKTGDKAALAVELLAINAAGKAVNKLMVDSKGAGSAFNRNSTNTSELNSNQFNALKTMA